MISGSWPKRACPQDLIYLAVAESGFQPTGGQRRSRAGGMWQFMPGTAITALPATGMSMSGSIRRSPHGLTHGT